MSTCGRLVIGIAVFVCFASAQDKSDLLHYSIVGSSSCKTQPCYSQVMASVKVQRFLLDLAGGPRAAEVVAAASQRGDIPLSDLMTLRLIRREADHYSLNFPLFTAADVRRINKVSEHYADSLAGAVLARRQEIESALQRYDAVAVDRKAVAYFVLGCASLDWGGLDVTARKKYRKTTEDRPDGNYVPAAEEKSEVSLKGIYWGSHNSGFRSATFTSFGDHFAIPRYTLPDLIWRMDRTSESDYPEDLKPLIGVLKKSPESTARQMGLIMLALRNGERPLAELARVAGANSQDAEAMLRLLTALQYVDANNGRYLAIVPVLTKRDLPMAKQLHAIGDQVMETWLAANYNRMRSELQDLSFTRAGVPFEDGFTMIWHYLFGMTNRKLVEAGLFADPYAASRRFKGSIPAVFDIKLN